jgi:uncharacterized protein (UPF0332 family)
MAILDHDQLLEQAELLIQPRRPGPPRQVDVRRAISAAYYAVFHFLMAQAADLVVGSTRRREARYSIVYRSVDHAQIRSLCQTIKAAQPDPRMAAPVASMRTGESVKLFAAVVQDLQAQRHTADYDAAESLRTADAVFAIALARKAIQSWRLAPAQERAAFITLLLFKRR